MKSWCISVSKIARQTLKRDDFLPLLEILILFQNFQQRNGHHIIIRKKHPAIKECLVNKLSFCFQDESHLGKITAHPRFLRFLGTCIDSSSNEVFILSDYVAGISLEVSKTKSKLKGKVSNML